MNRLKTLLSEKVRFLLCISHLKSFLLGLGVNHLTCILLCHVLLLLVIFGSFCKLLRSRSNCRCSSDSAWSVEKKKVSERCVVGKYQTLLVIWLQRVRTQVVFSLLGQALKPFGPGITLEVYKVWPKVWEDHPDAQKWVNTAILPVSNI